MTPAAVLRPKLCFGGRVVGARFARLIEKCPGIHVLEHFTHQQRTKEHQQAYDYSCHHSDTPSLVRFEPTGLKTQNGKKMVKMQRKLTPFSGEEAAA